MNRIVAKSQDVAKSRFFLMAALSGANLTEKEVVDHVKTLIDFVGEKIEEEIYDQVYDNLMMLVNSSKGKENQCIWNDFLREALEECINNQGIQK